MKTMIKPFLCLVLALVLLLTAGCTQKSDDKRFTFLLDGVAERGGVILEGIVPGMSKQEAEAAGLVLAAEPFRNTNDESGRSSESYPVRNTIALDKISFVGPEIQFTDGKQVNIALTTSNESDANALLEQLKKELDEPAVQNHQTGSTGTSGVQYWESDQGDYLLRISYVTHYRSDKAVGANLQIAYLYYEWFPELRK